MAKDAVHTRTSLRLAVIGVGGTGCSLLPLLAALPLAHITLIDGDTVEAANLPRQPLYGPADVGRLKVAVAQERMRHLTPDRPINAVPYFLDATNAAELLSAHDIIADCTDDLNVRLLIDRTCAQQRVVLVSGAVHGTQVQVVTLHAVDGTPTTLRSFFPKPNSTEQDGCDMRQVPASVTAFAGALMAEHITALTSGDRSRAGVLELIDTRTGQWLRIAPPSTGRPSELFAARTFAAGA